MYGGNGLSLTVFTVKVKYTEVFATFIITIRTEMFR